MTQDKMKGWLQYEYKKPQLSLEEETEIEKKITEANTKARNTRKVIVSLFFSLVSPKSVKPNPNLSDGATMVLVANTIDLNSFFDVIESTFLDAYLPEGDY